ncbi:gliding motility-associated C-terminal domain-containing protein [Flavobacterium sp. FlaQc-51]|uniref:T9SS type B sorting domain-containing protein n=1 Tax=Flavobacterium sp. FlaQc-51 TaxID=3374184 RepID=UPI0037564ADD
MEKLLLSLSSYLRDIKKIYFAVLFLLWSSIGLSQSITTNKTVTANATNCGIVNVKVDITGANPITRNSDVILAIDVSGSMGYTIPGDFKTSMDYAKDAALAFLTQAKVNPQNRIAIVAYSTTATLKIGLTYLNAAGVAAITAQINTLQATNSTNLYGGIVRSETELETNGRFDCSSARAIILLTDGVANVTGTNGNTTCNISKTSQCVTTAISAATNAKTTTKSSVVYNNQLFSVGLFGGLSGNINTNNSEQNIAKFTLDGIQGSPAYITQSGANLTSIYNQIATQISWVAQNLITKETVIPGFTIGSITTSKGTASLSGQVITWNTDFLNSETITLNYQLTPTGTACGNQVVSTSTLNYQNSSCANDSKAINTSGYFVPCAPVITGVLTSCGSTTLTAVTNAASPTYVWYKDNAVLAGQTSATLVVTASGAYKVKNGVTNCELTSAESTVSISPAAALTAPANASVSGCGTTAITGLLYNTTNTNITLAQLTSAGGTLPNSALLGTYTISYSDVATGTCPTIVTRTFKVVTGCGTITAVQTITITDTAAPTWTTASTALNTTLQCSDTAGLTTAQNQTPIATDNCGGTITYTKTSGSFIAGSCANSGTYTNTWIAKDVCLNTSTTFTQVITIIDNTPPIWITASTALNTTLQCSDTAGLTTAQNQSPVATDNCGGTIAYTKTSGSFIAGSCANSGTYTNTWIAKDICLNISTTFTQVITIEDTSAPTWTTASTALNTTLQCSDSAGLTTAQNQTPFATDNCGGTITYTKTSGSFIVGSCGNSGTYTNTWIAKDLCLNTSTTFTQVITIIDNIAPTWTTLATALNTTLQCSDLAGLTTAQNQTPVATDNCGGTITYTKTSGSFIAGSCGNSGTYTNTWIAKDVCLNTSTTFTQVITIIDNTAPNWTTLASSLNTTLQCSDTAGLTTAQNQSPVATDNCGGTITYTKTSGSFVVGSCGNSGTYTNTWIAKDLCLNTSTTFTQIITIIDSTAPTWTTASTALNTTLQCSDSAGLTTAQNQTPVATDNCGGTITYTKTSGSFIAGSCGNSGTYTNTWIAKDLCLNTSTTFTQVITIEDTAAPSWTTLAGSLNKTIECSDATALTSAQALFPIAGDLCDADVSNIVKVSGGFVVSASCSNAGTYTNTWTVKDDCGNTSDTFTQVITIEDTVAPTWTTQIGSLNKTIECSDTAGLTSAQALFPIAVDLCDADVSNIVKISGAFVASANCSNAGTYTNTWTVKDDCGNTSDTFTQVITIEDTVKPMFIGDLPLDITVSCDAVPEPANVDASDNCNGNLPIVFSEIKSDIQNSCNTNYTLTRIWTTSDCSANIASYTQIITVRDTTPPTGTAPTNLANLQTIADIPVGNASDVKDASDNCSTTVAITINDSDNGGNGCDGNPYILTRTYTLTDCAGNKTELKQAFTVENKVSVTGIASNVTCLGGKDGYILVTNSPGSTVIVRNVNNEVVANNNLPAGTYTLTATSSVNTGNQTCSAVATVVITQPTYTVKISGQIINKDTNTPLANVPVTLVPQGTTTGSILLQITGADGFYSFSGMPAGSYLVQVQDANLNSAYELYPIASSLFFTTLEDCKIQEHDFEYGKSTLPVLGDYVWYDTNANGIQDEWYDANNDGVVTKNIPDENGAVEYNKWEWIDLNGDGSYTGALNVGELNEGGFGNALSPNVIIDGPNGYHAEVIVGIEGFWRNRPETANPYGDYAIKLVKDTNLDAVAANLGATGLIKVIPSPTDKKLSNKTSKSQLHTVCSTTGGVSGYIVKITPDDLVHLNADFGVNCKAYSDIVANDDKAGPIVGVNTTTPNVINVLLNDTLEGIVVTASDVVITTITPNAFLQLNPDGSINVLPNAPAGTLTLVYQICEADQTSNCDTATVTITIINPVIANDDTYTNIGCNTFGLAGNVLSNDFKGITKASVDLVNFTLLTQNNIGIKTDPNITFDTLGNVTVSSLTPAGTYTYSYQICDKLSAANCDTATVTITVIPNGITTIASSACNDDSTLINLFSLLPENTPPTGIWMDNSNSNSIQGNTLNVLGLALGNYIFEYKITDQNCPRSILLNMEINDDCKVLACGNVVVHNAFSPNGDGMNDLFRIDSIDDVTCYPENNVEIYNRWGILVFETDNYNNTTNAFDGTSRGRTTVKQSDGLPTGTYFYIINYKSLDGNNVLQNNKKDGYLYLSK